MTAERPWPAPVLGKTIHLIGDLHNEVTAAEGVWRTESLRHDMHGLTRVLPKLSARVQVGDTCNNLPTAGYMGQEHPVAKALFRDLYALDGTPLVGVLGNHDLNFGGSGEMIARQYGWSGRNHVDEHDGFRFVCYSAENQTEDGSATTSHAWTIPADVLAWMDSAIGTDDTPVILVSHCPPWEQYQDESTGYLLEPRADIAAMVAAHPNVIAWMSGHRHHWYQDNARMFRSVSFGGRNVALIQSGTCGGTIDAAQRPTGHPVQSVRTNGSVFASYFDANDPGGQRWEIRVRDHSAQTWGTVTTGYQYHWTLSLGG